MGCKVNAQELKMLLNAEEYARRVERGEVAGVTTADLARALDHGVVLCDVNSTYPAIMRER
jgi:predicted O-methyltransferase YrrM